MSIYIKDTEIEEIIFNINNWLLRHNTLKRPMTYNEFMSLSVDLSNKIYDLFIIIIHLTPLDEKFFKGYSKDDVFIAGLLAKIAKLYAATVHHTCENQSDIVNIFSRPIFEAYQTMKYLINNPDKISPCRKNSFMPIVRNFNYLTSKEKTESLNEVENRMLIKIKNNIKSDGFNINEMAAYKSGDWKKLKPDIKDLHTKVEGSDSMYDFSHGIWSRFIHSDWQDIKFHHITTEDGFHFPSLKQNPVDIRSLPQINIIALDSLNSYLRWKLFDPSEIIKSTIDNAIDLNVRILAECDEILKQQEKNDPDWHKK